MAGINGGVAYQARVIPEHQGQKLRLEADLVERGNAIKPEAREKREADVAP